MTSDMTLSKILLSFALLHFKLQVLGPNRHHDRLQGAKVGLNLLYRGAEFIAKEELRSSSTGTRTQPISILPGARSRPIRTRMKPTLRKPTRKNLAN